MVASLLTSQNETPAFAEMLRPEPLADGTEPEERMIICGVSWERYLALDKALADDRSGPRFYHLNGELEMMTTSNERCIRKLSVERDCAESQSQQHLRLAITPNLLRLVLRTQPRSCAWQVHGPCKVRVLAGG